MTITIVTGKMAGAAGARRADIQCSGFGFGKRNQLPDALYRTAMDALPA